MNAMPPQATGGAQGGVPPQGGSVLGSITRTMPDDLRRFSAPSQSISGSGKVLQPSGTTPPPADSSSEQHEKGTFFSSLLHSKHHTDATSPSPVTASGQKIPVRGEGTLVPEKKNVWDNRVPLAQSAQSPQNTSVPKTPFSALPIPQKPIIRPVPPGPSIPQKPVVPLTPVTPPPRVIPTPASPPPRVPPPVIQPTQAPLPPRSAVIPPPLPPKAPTPVVSSPTPAPRMTLAPLPRPVTPPPPPRIVTPVSLTPRPAPVVKDEDIGIDLGISEYLKGGPTFQIDSTRAPIPTQPLIRPRMEAPLPPSTPAPLGGIWNPSGQGTSAEEEVRAQKPMNTPAVPPPSIFSPQARTSTPAPTAVPQYVSPKPTQSNADLDAEKQRLIGERAQIAGAKSAIEASLRSLIVDKQQAENQINPILRRETELAKETEELERKEQGLTGEVRRTIERDRWTKVEERRKVEQERLLIKRRLVGTESELHAKEEEQVSLIRREKDIDARIVWIDGEYVRREVRMKLAEVNQEKSAVEAHRTILDNGLKRLKASLEETEKNERRLTELKRSLAIKMPQTIAEEERFSQERFDLEKQMHDMEMRRWSLEDELKRATELFAKEDMAYLDVMHRAETLEGELKTLR